MPKLARDERGSVLVVVAVGIPTFILLAALALEFGSWYAHKRTVQNKADSAAFAAGVAYGYLFPQCTTNAALANQIADAARQYAGVAPSTYNASPASDPTADVTVNPDGPNPCQTHTTGDYSSPNGAIWTDVHVKQTVPSLFGGFGFVPSITANARVAVMKLQSMTGFRPLAIANPDYTTGECAWASFRNVNNGNLVVPDVQLTLGADGHWRATRNIPIGSQDVVVSARAGDCSTTSAQITYDNVGYIGQYDQSNGGGQPQFQGILFTPLSGGCTALYVSRRSPGCSFLVTAFIGHNPADRVLTVTADINGAVVLTDAGDNGTFQGTVPASQLLAGSGAGAATGTVAVTVSGTHNPPGPQNNVPFSFGKVQQIMAGNDVHEGPITNFFLSQIEINKNNTIQNEQIDLVLEPLRNSGPTTVLRARAGSAADRSLNGVVDCADGQNFADRFQKGCTSTFQVHPPALCTGPPTDPASCITGTATPGVSVTAVYNALFAPGGNCTKTPNNWPSYPNIPRGDPRLITVPVTRVEGPFTSTASHPVVGFGAFYVSGWAGMPSGCGGSEPNAATFGGLSQAAATANLGGEVWGHFIRFVQPSGAGTPQRTATPANDMCDPTATDIAACIATLVQ